ncbi:MAG: hypothetical protein P4L61_02720 [Candidatus Pacebacteria bacterium]|nr:hypothetical protein [Candidatus Paceibacterota bacterium]
MSRIRALRSPKRRTLRNRKTLLLSLAWLFAIVSIVAAFLLFLNSRFVRIATVSVIGPDAVQDAQVQSIVEKSIAGDYLWFIPKDSYFLFPSKALASSIPNEFSSIAKVSLARKGLTSVNVSVDERSPYAVACLGAADDGCYFADQNGVIYAAASSTEGALIVYRISLPAGANPLGVDFLDSGRLQSISAFVRGLALLGFVDDSVSVSSTDYDLSLWHQTEAGQAAPGASSTAPVMHLLIDESRPLSVTLDDFSAFWQEYMSKATDTDAGDLSSVDMRFGNNIIYKSR